MTANGWTAVHVLTGIALGAFVAGTLCKLGMDEMRTYYDERHDAMRKDRDATAKRSAAIVSAAEVQAERAYAAGMLVESTKVTR